MTTCIRYDHLALDNSQMIPFNTRLVSDAAKNYERLTLVQNGDAQFTAHVRAYHPTLQIK